MQLEEPYSIQEHTFGHDRCIVENSAEDDLQVNEVPPWQKAA